MPHEILVGGSCYTASAARELQSRAGRLCRQAEIKRIRGQWVYYLDIEESRQEVLEKVRQLLPDVDSEPLLASPSGSTAVSYYVTPRYLSPWSSQATSIAHVCGLKGQLRRIERGRLVVVELEGPLESADDEPFRQVFHDRMTEVLSLDRPSTEAMFKEGDPHPLDVVDLFAPAQDPLALLSDYNRRMGLSLDESEMQYLVDVFSRLGRPPHDVELFMFAQVNSE